MHYAVQHDFSVDVCVSCARHGIAAAASVPACDLLQEHVIAQHIATQHSTLLETESPPCAKLVVPSHGMDLHKYADCCSVQ